LKVLGGSKRLQAGGQTAKSQKILGGVTRRTSRNRVELGAKNIMGSYEKEYISSHRRVVKERKAIWQVRKIDIDHKEDEERQKTRYCVGVEWEKRKEIYLEV